MPSDRTGGRGNRANEAFQADEGKTCPKNLGLGFAGVRLSGLFFKTGVVYNATGRGNRANEAGCECKLMMRASLSLGRNFRK